MPIDRQAIRATAEKFLRKGGLASHLAILSPAEVVELLNQVDQAEAAFRSLADRVITATEPVSDAPENPHHGADIAAMTERANQKYKEALAELGSAP